jgi:hypothetical protein
MALTTAQLRSVAEYWCNQNFVASNVTAIYNTDHVQAAAQSIDQAFDTTINAAQSAGFGNMTIIQGINANIPAPFSGATLQFKINLACGVLLKRAGLI